jgi:hypothetical protein
MPYGIAYRNGYVWVASTFNSTVFKIAANTKLIDARFSSARNKWDFQPSNLNDAILKGADYDLYQYKTPVMIRGRCYKLGYGRILGCSGSEPKIDFPKLYRGIYFYFLQSVRLSRGTLVSSPQSSTALYFPDEGQGAAPVEVGFDTWVLDNRLIGPKGEIKVFR